MTHCITDLIKDVHKGTHVCVMAYFSAAFLTPRRRKILIYGISNQSEFNVQKKNMQIMGGKIRLWA